MRSERVGGRHAVLKNIRARLRLKTAASLGVRECFLAPRGTLPYTRSDIKAVITAREWQRRESAVAAASVTIFH